MINRALKGGSIKHLTNDSINIPLPRAVNKLKEAKSIESDENTLLTKKEEVKTEIETYFKNLCPHRTTGYG